MQPRVLIPPIASSCYRSRYHCAKGWAIPYVPTIEIFHGLISSNVIT